MTVAAITAADERLAQGLSSAPRLRLLPKSAIADVGPPGAAQAGAGEAPPPLVLASGADSVDEAPVLVAGRDPVRRAEVVRELGESMPAGTRFEELGTFWELLVRAPGSRMVILSGEVDEFPPESLLRAIGHRHPDLPVISLEAGAGAPR
jgi:hypothetical protein